MENLIFHGDCIEKLDILPTNSIDLVITDPPYGIDFQNDWQNGDNQFEKMENDDKIDTSFIPKIDKVTKDNSALYLFTRWDVYPEWLKAVKQSDFKVKNCIVWDKVKHGLGDLQKSYAPTHEFIIYAVKGENEINGKRPQDIMRDRRVLHGEKQHPAEKPVSLISELIKNSSDKGDIVLDPFAGSGSTLVAAEIHDRNYIGIEIAEKFVDLARKRIKESESQKKITDLSSL